MKLPFCSNIPYKKVMVPVSGIIHIDCGKLEQVSRVKPDSLSIRVKPGVSKL